MLNQYTNGEITFSEYQEQSNALIDELYSDNTIGDTVSSSAQKVGSMFEGISNKIGAVAETYGEAAYQYVADWINDLFTDYTTTTTTTNVDMLGYDALLYTYKKNSSSIYEHYYYCDYLICNPDGSSGLEYTVCLGELSQRYHILISTYSTGYTNSSSSYSTYNHTELVERDDDSWAVYGDVRYSDGTQAPSSEIETVTTGLNFDNATDQQLLDLVNDIYEELERQNPDLSNVEALLTSIYYRLGALDSDNDNSLLAEINAAIIALAQSNRADTNELITKLDELKDSLKSDETTETDLTDITNELKDISSTLKGLALIEVAENLLETTEQEQKLFNEYANLIPLLVDKVGLAIVQQTMTDIESMIFTSSTPNDLKATAYGTEYTILSKDMFSEDVIKYINIAKTFISILLVYLWCSKMRKNLAGGDS